MFHRIRYALGDDVVEGKLSGTVEADESHMGGKRRDTKRGRRSKDCQTAPIVAAVERKGKARSEHMRRVASTNVGSMLTRHAEPIALLVTDEFSLYNTPSQQGSAGYGRAKHEFDSRWDIRHVTHGQCTVARTSHVGGKRLMWKRAARV